MTFLTKESEAQGTFLLQVEAANTKEITAATSQPICFQVRFYVGYERITHCSEQQFQSYFCSGALTDMSAHSNVSGAKVMLGIGIL